MTNTPFVLAVVVNWNAKDDLLACVGSILGSDYPKDRLKVLVVDNASKDGSCSALRNAYPEALLIENEKNEGYAKAANKGLMYGINAGAEFIWLFNNDVVVAPDALKQLIAVAGKSDPIGVIAPVIYSFESPQQIAHAGYKISFWTGRLKKLKAGKDIFLNPKERFADVDSILGCSNLIKSAVFKRIGYLRPVYELYFEETDFNVRARANGFRVVVVKDAKVWHKNAATMNRFILRRAFLLLRNLFLFEVLNARLWHLLVFIPYYFIIHIPYFLIRGTFIFLDNIVKYGIISFVVNKRLEVLGRKEEDN